MFFQLNNKLVYYMYLLYQLAKKLNSKTISHMYSEINKNK